MKRSSKMSPSNNFSNDGASDFPDAIITTRTTRPGFSGGRLSRFVAAVAALVISTAPLLADTSAPVIRATGLPAAVPSKARVVKLGLNEWVAVAQAKGWLKEEFAKLNTTVEIVDIRAVGAPSVEASLFRRGDLHIGRHFECLQCLLRGGAGHHAAATDGTVRRCRSVRRAPQLVGELLKFYLTDRATPLAQQALRPGPDDHRALLDERAKFLEHLQLHPGLIRQH